MQGNHAEKGQEIEDVFPGFPVVIRSPKSSPQSLSKFSDCSPTELSIGGNKKKIKMAILIVPL